MGLRYRGRSKGKDGWINWSWSNKTGVGVSASAKVGPFTWNSGNGKSTKRRITTNLPGGFYHVTSTEKSQPKTTATGSSTGGGGSVLTFFLALIMVLAFITAVASYPYLTALFCVAVGWVWYLRSKQ